MKASVAHASLLSVGQLPRQHGEAETPTSNQPPRVDQGRGLLGPRCSVLDPWLRSEAKGQGRSAAGPKSMRPLVDAWRLIGRGRLHFPMLPRQLLDLTKGWRG